MKKVSWVFSVGVFAAVAFSTPVVAMENGASALGDDRIISTRAHGSSAYLYDDRIVFTNGHALYKQDGTPWELDSFTVLRPGAMTFDLVGSAKVVKTFVAEGYRDWNPRKDWARPNDFGILILDRPIANVPKATIATEAQVKKLQAEGAMITTGGYGYQSVEDRGSENRGKRIVEPKQATLPFASGNYLQQAIAGYLAGRTYDLGRGPYPEMLGYHVVSSYDGPGTCDGDSGSGYFVRDGKNSLYIGTIGSHLGITNCGADTPIPGYKPMFGILPAFYFTDLIAEAEAWVAANPVKGAISQPAQKTLKSFVGSTTTLSASQKAEIAAFVKANGNAGKFVCTGIRYQTQPLSENIKVRARAKAACDYAESLNRNLSTWYQTKATAAKSFNGKVLLTAKP